MRDRDKFQNFIKLNEKGRGSAQKLELFQKSNQVRWHALDGDSVHFGVVWS